MDFGTILLVIIGGLVGIYFLFYNIWFKIRMGKRDSYIDNSLFVKYSTKTAEENPNMIINEYNRLIDNEQGLINSMINDTDLKYIWRNKYDSTRKYSFSGGIEESLLISQESEEILNEKTIDYKHKVLSLSELILLYDKYTYEIIEYKRHSKKKFKMEQELKEFKFLYHNN